MTTRSTPDSRAPHAIGLYLAAVQFCFALGWVVYVAYLPRLAQQAGIETRWIPWLLMADQLVFLLTDLAVGLASDRAARVLGRIGRAVAAASLLSAAAFAALPWIAPKGSQLLFLVVTGAWVVTTSALRAPPLTLLGRYVAKPSQPTMATLNVLGLGVANAVAPYVGLQLKGMPPELPFALSALVLGALSLGMVAAERALAGGAAEGVSPANELPAPPTVALAYLLACVVGAVSFQWHHAVSTGALAQRAAGPEGISWLLPVFWVGFNLALAGAGALVRRQGPLPAMAIGAELAMIGTAAAAFVPSLPGWVAAQLACGAGWALLLCAAFSAALHLGATGREGLMSGALQSTLAAAALGRIALVTTVTPAPAQAIAAAWWPAVGFAACAGLLVWLAVRPAR